MAGAEVRPLRSQSSLYPAMNERRALFAGGPVLVNHGNVLEILYHPGKDQSGMRAEYGAGGKLVRTEERDARGRPLETRTFGQNAETITYDPAQGKPVEWQTWRALAKGGVEWSLERAVGAARERRLIHRKKLSGVEPCLDQEIPEADVLAQAVDKAICAGETQATKCYSGPLTYFSDSPNPSVKAAGPLCVEESCQSWMDISPGQGACRWVTAKEICSSPQQLAAFKKRQGRNFDCSAKDGATTRDPLGCYRTEPAAEGLKTVIQETLFEGATCLAKMGSGTSETSRANQLAMGPGKDLVPASQLPMRNAALLLAIYGQSSGFGSAWNSQQQRGGEVTESGDMAAVKMSADAADARLSTYGNPLSIACGNKWLSGASDGRQVSLAAAALPGAAGWPAIVLRTPLEANQLKPGTAAHQKLKSVLFHEMLHLLGYPHDEGVLPLHTACQNACFPTSAPPQDRRCPLAIKQRTQEINQQICSGKAGASPQAPEFRRRKKDYFDGNCACFFSGNPLGPEDVCR